MHQSHLCGEGGDDVELIYMQGECKVCSLVCMLTERMGFYLFHVSRQIAVWYNGGECEVCNTTLCSVEACACLLLSHVYKMQEGTVSVLVQQTFVQAPLKTCTDSLFYTLTAWTRDRKEWHLFNLLSSLWNLADVTVMSGFGPRHDHKDKH